jgi:cellulose synthase/poly-beta-1,6-N-acetylglucosamine synthase-like glycosyltransferase
MYLSIAGFVLGIIHFVVPTAYYAYLRRFCTISTVEIADKDYEPRVSVVVPTYNEASLVEEKLNNLVHQEYPLDKINLILVDSASTDDTVRIAKSWREANPIVRFQIVEEQTRTGKAVALNTALQYVSEEIVIFTDADSIWAPDALNRSMPYFSDPAVCAITGSKQPRSQSGKIENTYRDFYNRVRVWESNLHSTPVFNGEFAAFRSGILRKLGGFPSGIGADDSHMATMVALKNGRAIAAPDVKVYEVVPEKLGQLRAWRVRRAKHLTQHFVQSLRAIRKAPPKFRGILAMETFLNLVNPWVLLLATGLLLVSVLADSLVALLVMLALLLSVILVRKIRRLFLAWIVNQLVLCYAMLASVRSMELVWKNV